jgi:hypothetical protein
MDGKHLNLDGTATIFIVKADMALLLASLTEFLIVLMVITPGR